MDAKKLFPTNYICDDDLGDRDITLTMSTVKMEAMPDGSMKAVLYFHEAQKGMTLNKVNGSRIIAMYGSETDDWMGKRVTLYPSETTFQGDVVGCVRVRPTPPAQQVDPPATDAPAPRAETPQATEATPASAVGF